MIQKSYAKINLFLFVIGKREDGYHNIHTLMHKIDFFDYIEIKKISSNSINLKTNVDEINDEKNLAYRAALLFFKESGIKPQIAIDIEKHIPLGSGLGGGSSNCAYTLNMLNEMFDFPLRDRQIYDIACRLGSDIPFFLSKKPAGMATGRGEIIKEIECDVKNRRIFLAIPQVNISTAYIYSKLLLTTGKSINKMPFVVNSGRCSIESLEPCLFNDLESVALKEFRELKELKSILAGYFGNALLSGSGASIFSIINPEVRVEKRIESLLVSKGVFFKTVNFSKEGR